MYFVDEDYYTGIYLSSQDAKIHKGIFPLNSGNTPARFFRVNKTHFAAKQEVDCPHSESKSLFTVLMDF